MIGRRVRDPLLDPAHYLVGEFGKWHGWWWGRAPNGLLANLKNHEVVEHEDGSITVSPSIRVERSGVAPLEWHGFLTKGEWKSC